MKIIEIEEYEDFWLDDVVCVFVDGMKRRNVFFSYFEDVFVDIVLNVLIFVSS